MIVQKNIQILYLVTDRTWLKDQTLPEVVELAIEIKKITDQYQIPFVINDNIKIAMEIDADGVHVGQKDLAAYFKRIA